MYRRFLNHQINLADEVEHNDKEVSDLETQMSNFILLAMVN